MKVVYTAQHSGREVVREVVSVGRWAPSPYSFGLHTCCPLLSALVFKWAKEACRKNEMYLHTDARTPKSSSRSWHFFLFLPLMFVVSSIFLNAFLALSWMPSLTKVCAFVLRVGALHDNDLWLETNLIVRRVDLWSRQYKDDHRVTIDLVYRCILLISNSPFKFSVSTWISHWGHSRWKPSLVRVDPSWLTCNCCHEGSLAGIY